MDISKIVAEIDDNTSTMIGLGYEMNIIGDIKYPSPFIRALMNKAGKFGIRVTNDLKRTNVPTIIDTEWRGDKPITLHYIFDVDSICKGSKRPSCTAEAIHRIISNMDRRHMHIMIVGKGHAVKGLDRMLIDDGHTVSICHSKTSEDTMQKLCTVSDLIVNSSPIRFIAPSNRLLDITNNNPKQIGQLTTSIMINRVVGTNWRINHV